AVLPCNGSETSFVVSDQNQLGHRAILADYKAAFDTNRRERMFQMLCGRNVAGCAVHDDANGAEGHVAIPWSGRHQPADSDVILGLGSRTSRPGDKSARSRNLRVLRANSG